ncbi:MAG TPA: hypothetical protein VFZ62_03970 [Candidatus Saccharimonadales bacterium]
MNSRTKTFFESEQGILARKELMKMTTSEQYRTRSMYSSQDASQRSFVDKHMKYMSQFPDLNCPQYISNLKLMTKRPR